MSGWRSTNSSNAHVPGRLAKNNMTAPCIVLVVEDEALIRLDLADRLERTGCATLQAGSAAEAIAILEQHRDITVVFTDIQRCLGPWTVSNLRTTSETGGPQPSS